MLVPLLLLIGPTAPKFPLTVESIMRGPALIGHPPRGLRWSADGSEVEFTWAKADGSTDPAYKDYMVKRDGTGLVAGGTRPFAEKPYKSPGNSTPGRSAYVSEGDIYIKDAAANSPQRLTHTPEMKSEPEVVLAGLGVAYLQGGNLFRVMIADGSTAQLTDFKPEDDAPLPATTSETTLAQEEAELFKTYPPAGRAQPVGTGRGSGRGRQGRVVFRLEIG